MGVCIVNLISKTKLSESVGWSEANGRQWIKFFQKYIPYVEKGNKILFTEESMRIVSVIKHLNESGLNRNDIRKVFEEKGIPEDKKTLNEILTQKRLEVAEASFNKKIAETIPSQKEIVLPLLRIMHNGKIHTSSEVTDALIKYYNLSPEQRTMTYENGKDSIFLSRIRGAKYSLKKEGYIEEISKHTYQITNEGIILLNDTKEEIEAEIEELEKVIDPLTIVKDKLNELQDELAENLLKKLRNVHWTKFEDIVIELLTTMGYGDGEVTQRTNDEGLDGVIKEDKLGLDNIYVQAKKWGENNSIGRELVQSFSGALDAKGARKGVFITTSKFTAGAQEYVKRLETKKIILIDGKQLAKYMIEYKIGVNIKETLIVKDVDDDYFKEE